MAISEEEKRIARAYNAGYVLSAYEPKLLEQIIRNNKNNEFVKVMDTAREHQEFHRGIPKKEFTQAYKNGYRNAQALCQHEPELLERMLNSQGMGKDYTDGLNAGKKEYKIRQSMSRMKQERDQQQERDRGLDKNMDMGMEY
ncbi:hypothetical protein ACFQ3S_15020 [Mucilaginibacter terrae]|uniref:hypothetical protein n=1 Tax=Mucilaginibacter terrae TaxID=1955052 RepID=UPI0036284381